MTDIVEQLDIAGLVERAAGAPREIAELCKQLLDRYGQEDADVSFPRGDLVGIHRVLAWSSCVLGDTSHALAALTAGRELATSPNSLETGHLAEFDRIEAFVLLVQGHTEHALELLKQSLNGAEGPVKARVHSQLGAVLTELGDFDAAFRDYQMGLEEARTARSQLARLDLLNNRAVTYMYVGDLAAAENDLLAAGALADELGERASATVTHNLGVVRARSGRLPEAVALFAKSTEVLDRTEDKAGLANSLVDQAELLLNAGLLDEALAAADKAVELFAQLEAPARRLQVRQLEARILASKGNWRQAEQHAQRAVDEAAATGSNGPADQQALDLLEAMQFVASIAQPSADTEDVSKTPPHSLESHPDLAIDAGQLLMRAGRLEDAEACFVAAESEANAAALRPMHLALRDASLAHLRGDITRSLSHVHAGIDVGISQVADLGVSELRSMGNRRVRQLAALGTDIELERNNIGAVVDILERERRVLLAPEPKLTETEHVLVGRRRAVVEALGRAEPNSPTAVRLTEQRGHLEHELRLERRANTSATGHVSDSTPSTPQEPASAIYLFVRGRTLHAAVMQHGEARLVADMSFRPVRRALRGLDLVLAARAGGSTIRVDRLLEGTRNLLAPLLDEIKRHDSVVVIPDPTLGHIPWTLFTDVPISLSSSMDEWRKSTAIEPSNTAVAVFVAGPDLEFSVAEATKLAALSPDTILLTEADANAANVVDAFGRAQLVHFATHGRFRSDNPLVSAVELADGQLTFFDLLKVERVPQRLVFSACDIGRYATRSALGLSALLTDRGCRGFVASAGPASDEATAELMTRFHEGLADGKSMSVALTEAQAEMVSSEPSVSLFMAFGAG